MRGIWVNSVLTDVLAESEIRSQIRTNKTPFIPPPDLNPDGLQVKNTGGGRNLPPGLARDED